MSDERLCVCSDSCVSGIVGGPGCTSEPANHPTGGYRPPYLAARAQSSRRLTERDVAYLFPGHRPALRIVRGERGDEGRDYGDEDVERPVVPLTPEEEALWRMGSFVTGEETHGTLEYGPRTFDDVDNERCDP